MSRITVHRARRVHTLDPNRPEATCVAVRDGRVLAVGSLDDVSGWGPHDLDERHADRVLLPGLVEGHSHLMAGTMWQHAYCGWYDVPDPDGRIAGGARSLDAVIGTLRAHAQRLSDPAASVTGWGLDPIHFCARGVTRADLDAVSNTRPVGVLHGSGHILYASSLALQQAGLLHTGIDHPGIPLGADGLPTGELKGPDAMMPLLPAFGIDRAFLGGNERGIRAFGRLAARAGVTTATDLGATLADDELALVQRLTGEDDYPVRLVSVLRTLGLRPADAIDKAVALRTHSTERLRLGAIKIVSDGSIQGFSARLRWPGYYNGAPNGLWYVAPETVSALFRGGLQRGVQVHVHTNGDEAVEMVMQCLHDALLACPAPDHRFTLQHCQLADAAQFRRMRALGLCVNLFVNHVYYWGEAHRSRTVGPDRAERMNACRTALECGVPFSIHSDAPITPMRPLFTAWCAVNRLTAAGRVLGAHQRIGVADALHAITLGAARTLKLDHEIGSIECGKRADFCVLDDDPFLVAPERLSDVPVWGTVLGGRSFQALPAA